MKTYLIKYTGHNRTFKYFLGRVEINATSEREAVLDFFSSRRPCFQDGGTVKDQDGNAIMNPGENRLEYDGGYFYAEPLPDVAWWDRDKVLIVENVSAREDLISAVNAFLDGHPGSAAVFTKAAPDDNGAWFVPVLWA